MNKYSTGFWTTLLVFLAYQLYQAIYTVPPLPHLPLDQYWGPGNPPKTQDTSIRPFKVEFKPEKLSYLKSRLSDVSWLQEPLEGISFQYGFNSNYLKEVIQFWRNQYNSTEAVKRLNKYPQFKTNIQGLDIHFVHYTQPNPKNLRVIPVLMGFCWPIYNHRLIDEIVKPREGYDFVFSIVAPSLPGFGYSQGSSKPGLGVAQISVIFRNLMERLGYKKYVTQAGDWNSEVLAYMSVLYPEKVIGLHTVFPTATAPSSVLKHIVFSVFPSILVESKFVSRLYPLSTWFFDLMENSGYIHLQATKPDTIGVALKDSPIGLAAHLLDKFSSSTNKKFKNLPDGGLTKKYSLTDLLDNVMVYFDSDCITTSMRLYAETFTKAQIGLQLNRIPIHTPTVGIRNEHDFLFFSSCQLRERFYNLVRVTDVEDAGHMPALEIPHIIAEDLWKSIADFEQYKVKQ